MKNTQIQSEVRGFRQTGTVAAVVASVNTGVVAFANEPVAGYPAPGYAVSTYCTVSTVAASATAGTSYKFTRRGVYTMRAYIPGIAGTGANLFAISLDWAGANLLAATTPTPALSQDIAFNDGVAAQFASWKLNATLRITDAMAGDPLRGTARLHGNTGGGAVPTAAEIDVANVTVWVEYVCDLAG